MKRRSIRSMWTSLVDDREALWALSLGNLAALCLLLVLELWAWLGGK